MLFSDTFQALSSADFFVLLRQKEGADMYEKLLSIGYTEQMALDILRLFPNLDDLKQYVYFAELFYQGERTE